MKKVGKFLNHVTSFGGKAPDTVTKAFRYTFSGTSSTALDFIILFVLTEYVGVYYLWSATISFILANATNYLINLKWGFKDSQQNFYAGYLFFLTFGVLGLAITLLVISTLVEHLSMNYLLARAIAVIITGIFNFILNLTITFKTYGNNRYPVRRK